MLSARKGLRPLRPLGNTFRCNQTLAPFEWRTCLRELRLSLIPRFSRFSTIKIHDQVQ